MYLVLLMTKLHFGPSTCIIQGSKQRLCEPTLTSLLQFTNVFYSWRNGMYYLKEENIFKYSFFVISDIPLKVSSMTWKLYEVRLGNGTWKTRQFKHTLATTLRLFRIGKSVKDNHGELVWQLRTSQISLLDKLITNIYILKWNNSPVEICRLAN